MTLKPSQVLSHLQSKRADFEQFGQATYKSLQLYQTALKVSAQATEQALLERLHNFHSFERGAEPVEPLGQWESWVMPSGLKWQSREESHHWVRDRLLGISTFAVDGSQIYPGKDLSIPIALVQIGWFENFHQDGRYEKDIAVDVMTPKDLKITSGGEPVDRRVNMRRFEMETQRLIQYIEDHAEDPNSLAFLDGSLVATFAEAFDEETRQFYVRCIVQLLQASQTYRVPLVGYIDTTYARDLTVMLQRLEGLPDAPALHDASLFHRLLSWGDRTPLFRCRRLGILKEYPLEVRDQIVFTYLKAHEGYPVRLELPLWVYEQGLADRVLDWVRGEIIIGGGYPYAIETADQTAVLKAEDRHMFFRLLQDWATNENLHLRLSRKMVSKVRRR